MSSFATTPMTAQDMEWWAEYSKARATARCEVVDYGDAPPTRPMLSPQMVREIYDGMELVELESEPRGSADES